jgi:hypothetical protein
MDAYEVTQRVTAVERERAKAGRIDWYDRNIPNWWKNLKECLDDPVWEGELDDYCAKWFGKSEAEMRGVLGLQFIPEPREELRKQREPPSFPRTITEQIMEKKLTNAEKQRAYRARKAGK